MKIKLIFTMIMIANFYGFSQSNKKALEIYNLINEARINPTNFLAKYKAKITKYEPKFEAILKNSSPTEKVKWDKDLAINCKERVYGNLNPKYKGVNKMCGSSSGNGFGYFEYDALYFVCDSYTHIMNADEIYFGFYIDSKGHSFAWGASCNTKKYLYKFSERIDSSGVNFKKIKTAYFEGGLTLMDKEMIKEINFVRQYPKVYASIVAKYLADESKSWWGLSKDEYDAGIELIEELKALIPVQILYPKKCVYNAARAHGEDCKKRGFSDHTGSDGSSPFDRISNFCNGLKGNENIVGGRKDVRILVIQLLIDSGISSRGHRYNMLNPDWKYIGCYGYQGINMYNYIQNFAMD